MKQESITIISKRMKKKIRIADILYIIKSEYLSLIHLIDGDILQTITPIYELKEMLGDDCIEVKKGCIVSVSAIFSYSGFAFRFFEIANAIHSCYSSFKAYFL